MGVNDTVREWSGMTDGEVANQIFSSLRLHPRRRNTDDDSPQHDPDAAQPLPARERPAVPPRARASQRQAMRVACTDTPGVRTGYFVTPDVGATPPTP